MASKRWIAIGIGLLALSLPGLAQEPKPGDYYEDRTDLGFKVKVPAKWEPIPAAPDDGNLIIKYDPKSNKEIRLGKNKQGQEVNLELHVWILKLDRRKSDAAPDKGPNRTHVSNHKTIEAWLKNNLGSGFTLLKETQKTLQVNKVDAVEAVYASKRLPDAEVRVYTMTYKLQKDVDVVFVGCGPGEGKWNGYLRPLQDMARSFKTTAVAEGPAPLAEGSTLRDRKRAEILDDLSRAPGWKLYESPSYFVVSNYPKKPFIDELMKRLEAIRAVYEVDYPAAKAQEIRAAAARAKTGAVPAKPGEGDDGDPQEGKTDVAVADAPGADALEMSRCSIVRVCKNKDDYHSYGGPPGSAGYWSSNAKELVVYDDSQIGGKGDTWITLNHEAFHQYIYYFYGNIAPHSWYNEGTGDFYSGYMYKNGRFELEKNPWRKSLIAEAIQQNTFVPFEEIFRYKQSEYYAPDKVGICYAQGWSMIYFLRTGKKNNAKGWNSRWDTFLEDYMRVLAATGKPEQAIEQSLSGIDVAELQAAWIDYTK